MTQPLSCPACRKEVTIPPGPPPVFPCPHCRQELRVDGESLAVVVDPADFRRRPDTEKRDRDVFRDL